MSSLLLEIPEGVAADSFSDALNLAG